MNKILAIALASGLAVSIPAAALAQAYGGGAAGSGQATDLNNPPSDAGINIGTPVGTDVSWQQLLDHLKLPVGSAESATGMTDDIASISDSSNIQFIDIATLSGVPAGEQYDQELQASLDANADAQMELHSAISANTVLMEKLMAAGYAVEDVVAFMGDEMAGFYFYIRVPANAAQGGPTVPAPPSAPEAGAGGAPQGGGLAGPGATGGD